MIKERRQKLNLSITAVATQLGVSRSQASRLENGKSNITAEMAIKLEKVLGISRAELRPDLFIIEGV